MGNRSTLWSLVFVVSALSFPVRSDSLQRMKYNNPGLVVDLGVGLWAWPLPMDYDNDGDNDLLVSCPDKPYNGVYFFENKEGNVKAHVLEPGVRIGPASRNIQPSYVNDKVRFLIPGFEMENNFAGKKKIHPQENIHPNKVRANQWRYVDYEADGDLDIIVGVGDWTEYGWDNAFNEKGQWTRGPLHGYVYLIENSGTTELPTYKNPVKVLAGGKAIDVYGMPTPNFADFDNDGDLDIVCGEFLDRLTYFENIGTRTKPQYSKGIFLTNEKKPIKFDLEMIVPIAFDWDNDGDMDLVVGEEDGRVAFVENSGKLNDGIPQFFSPKFFKQKAAELKFGALVTPWSCDWDGDGDEDLICGNTAGYVGFIENLDGGNPPKWATPQYLKAHGEIIRIQAGYNGSIQGPCEAKWGYTTLSVADWDHDGQLDILVNSIWGKVLWFKNIGTKANPKLDEAQPVLVEWTSTPPKPNWFWWNPIQKELATQWRTTPVAYDWNKDGLNDLVMLDSEGYLVLYERSKLNEKLTLLPPKRIFYADGPSGFDGKQRIEIEQAGPLRLNVREAGGSGRRKLCFVDWDLDGKIDILVNSESINLLKNVSKNDKNVFSDKGKLTDHILAGHTTSPTVVDWDKNGVPDLLIGAEDGCFYFVPNSKKSY
jgi:hypothetical protein